MCRHALQTWWKRRQPYGLSTAAMQLAPSGQRRVVPLRAQFEDVAKKMLLVKQGLEGGSERR